MLASFTQSVHTHTENSVTDSVAFHHLIC